MGQINRIGLKTSESEELSDLLNDIFTNYSIFYQNTRGYHWNIQGDKFFELYLKFEELYNNFFVTIDEVAERILTFLHAPLYKFTEYSGLSSIPESIEGSNG